jgi:amino acid transporter
MDGITGENNQESTLETPLIIQMASHDVVDSVVTTTPPLMGEQTPSQLKAYLATDNNRTNRQGKIVPELINTGKSKNTFAIWMLSLATFTFVFYLAIASIGLAKYRKHTHREYYDDYYYLNEYSSSMKDGNSLAVMLAILFTLAILCTILIFTLFTYGFLN